MNKLLSKVADNFFLVLPTSPKPAQISDIFHKNLKPRDFSIMTLVPTYPFFKVHVPLTSLVLLFKQLEETKGRKRKRVRNLSILNSATSFRFMKIHISKLQQKYYTYLLFHPYEKFCSIVRSDAY